ncbi:hypothetical protein [Nitrospira calida]|jgi:hypothetical protein
MAKRSRFTKEFNLEALRLWKSSGRPAAAVARELQRLRREHACLREERDILN